MTVTEFKTAHPEMAHLEGDALWNAMEDSILLRAKPVDAYAPIFDWKGNQIKAGMTICFIGTKPLFSKIGWMIPKGDGKYEQIMQDIPESERCWKVSEFEVIEDRKGILFYKFIADDYTYHMQLAGCDVWMQPADIIAIKGISDNEEEYFKSL